MTTVTVLKSSKHRRDGCTLIEVGKSFMLDNIPVVLYFPAGSVDALPEVAVSREPDTSMGSSNIF